ncbi:MAG TPA: ATP-binding protein [Stellaceae bacterium]|jgi:signal transduction histidine kinase|nr:ATP-binding protein [Stellaceae bacterium]
MSLLTRHRAVPNRPGDATAPPAEKPAPGDGAPFGAIGTLRALLVGTIIVPLLLGAVGGYFSYRASYQAAATALDEAVAVAAENTTKILDTHMLVAARIDDLLAVLTDSQIRADEKALHDRIAQQIADLPQVAAAWVLNGNGRETVSARVFPVNRDFDHSGREDFRVLREGRIQTFIWALRARSLADGDYRAYFTVSQRRQAADGSFRGIIVVAVSGPYFASFYNSLLGGSAQYTASVLREDGTSLARYPESEQPPAPRQEDALLAKALADKATGGIIASGSPFSEDGSLVAYQRLASYPVYVAIGRTRASITRDWLEMMAGYVAIGVPASVGLMLLSLLALRRTRREQLALAEAGEAIAQRAAIEAQLHQSQKMEAVGLLTAGIAHDFNNLLTIVVGNVALLEAGLDPHDQKRHKFIAAAISGCERASALTERLLGFARREPVDPRPVDIDELITQMPDLAWHSLGDRIAVDFRLAGDLWPVFVDPEQLENALLNLALNARDAMGGRGRLTVETANVHVNEADPAAPPSLGAGDYVAISIGDTGCGMPQEVQDKAFDPFFTTKEAGKGTGLGLSQVNGFVTRSGGRCTISSEPGRGTTVKLFLPRYLGAVEGGDAPVGNGAGEDAPGAIAVPVASHTGAQAEPDAAERGTKP